MPFANAHYIKPIPYFFHWKKHGFEFCFRKHCSIDFEVDLIPSPQLVYRKGGSVRRLSLSLTFIVWTASIHLYHGI
jgi:hypothetical protein